MDDRNYSLSGTGNETVPTPTPATGNPLLSRAERRRSQACLAASGAGASDETTFLDLRRKVQNGELLSASTERLLKTMKFNGHLTVVVQHGRVVKSGYEEGYFRRRNDLGVLLET